jgi:Ca-activated chloride channel family protein
VRATAITTAPDGVAGVPGVAARIQLAVKIGDAIPAGRAPGSPSHALQVGSDGLVELRDVAGARLDRDLVVRWPVAGASVGLALQLARPADRDETYGLLTIVPPAREVHHRALARDLIVLIDTSGSMSGGPLDKAKRVVAQLIESLGDDDRLELIEFASAPRRYRSEPVRATQGEQQAAIRWVRALQAGGSTEMRAAVIEAMRSLRPGAQRQVVLATDGYIGGEEQIIQQLYRDLPRSCRLHFLGVGSAVNRSLSTAMARAGRGAEVLCDLDEDVDRAARRIIDRTRLPILTNVTLVGSALVAQAPELLPDVFEGAPFVAAVQLRPGELIVRGDLARDVWEQRITVPPGGAAGNQAIVALFGRERVADLEAHHAVGDTRDTEDRDAEIEGVGLAFQIATRRTSWIAVDEARTVTGPSRHEDMPQALPYGTTAAAFGLRAPQPGAPSGAPGAPSPAMAMQRSSLVIVMGPPEDFDDEPTGAAAMSPAAFDMLEERSEADDLAPRAMGRLREQAEGLAAELDVAPSTVVPQANRAASSSRAAPPRAPGYAPPPTPGYASPAAPPAPAQPLAQVPEPKRREPLTTTLGAADRTGAAAVTPAASRSPTRWRIAILLAILALVIAALAWWLAR